uniref:Hexosyltransferase n=1 Tax=Arion vulgaris TaxID=1028688 RepID=A0A0B7AAB3_9EUPU
MLNRRYCCLKTPVYILIGLSLITCVIMLYETHWSQQTFAIIMRRLHPFKNSIESDSNSTTSMLSVNEMSLMYENITFSRIHHSAYDAFYKLKNGSECGGCLRPKVLTFNNYTFREIRLQDGMPANYSGTYFQAKTEIVKELVKQYLLVPKLNCSDVYLLAIQPSILDRQNERDVVRNTWGSVAREQKWPNRQINANVKVIFVVARLDRGNFSQQMKTIRSESDLHNDILYIDMVDGYYSLTLKVLSAFKWVKDNCPCVKFVLKVDYDTFVNVPLLVDTLLYFENRFEFTILAHAYTENESLRKGKWIVPWDQYPFERYIPYASGCGYVLPFKVLTKIVDTVPYVQMFAIEDAFITGVMRRVIGCQMFSMYTYFTHRDDGYWNKCLMFRDEKMLGTSNDGAGRHNLVWSTFSQNSCE